jgi:hypothetical protein
MHLPRLALLLAAAVSLTVAAPRLRADATVTTDWTQNLGAVKSGLHGLNIWDGMDPAIAANTGYKNGLDQLRPNFSRFHAGEQVSPGTSRAWVDANGNWDFARIATVLNNTKTYAPVRMVTISRWPASMNQPGNANRLDPAKYDLYADWCAQLAEWLKNNNHGITHYEPFNEVEDNFTMTELSTIFKKCRQKIRAKDASALVGGPVFRNPWNYGNVSGFISGVGSEIDFFSYHHYASGGVNGGPAPLGDIYGATLYGGGIADRASGIRHQLRQAGLNIPVLLTEHNMYYTGDPDYGARWMTSHRSAVFDALVLKGAAESQNLDALHTWNDSDDTYGKLDRTTGFGLRAGGRFFRLARELLSGEVARTATSNDQAVLGFAVYNGTRHVLALINRTDSTHVVATAFGGWSPATAAYTEHRISANEGGGYASSARTWSGAPVVTMPANSVYLLQFADNNRAGGRRPFGGSARALASRIQAEDYDLGGQGDAYYDSSYRNGGNSTYRADSVDLYTTGDTGGGHSVGGIEAAEELKYTVNVAVSGAYSIKLRASSYWGVGSGAITVKLDGATLASLSVPQTWNDDGFTDVNASVTVPAGSVGNNRTLVLAFATGGLRVNWFELASTGGLANGTYRIVNRNSGKALSVLNGSTADGAQIVQFDYYGNNDQKWTFTRQSDGAYHIVNVNSGKYMDISGASTADGAANIQWPLNYGNNQKWKVEDAGSGYHRIVNLNSNKLLDIEGASTANNARDIQWPGNGGWNQMWTITAP